jgi:hypothetical protein
MNYLQDQAVMNFAGTAARGSAIGTAVQEGMISYLNDSNLLEAYDGSAWKQVASTTGSILQVLSTTKTDTFSASLSAGAGTDVTGLNVTITPKSSSSKILILVQTNVAMASANFVLGGIQLMRNSTPIGIHDVAGSRNRLTAASAINGNSTVDNATIHVNFLDSPSTTSAITYAVRAFNQAAATRTILVNRSDADGNTAVDTARTVSTITVMEVAG